MSQPLWSDERIDEETKAASTDCDDVDGEWVWIACWVMSRSTAETLLTKMRDEYEAKLSELRKQGCYPMSEMESGSLTIGGPIVAEWNTPEEDAAWAHLQDGETT